MNEPDNRLPKNAPGPFYVTSECISCDLCSDVAPAIFRRDDWEDFSIVFRQPETAAELSAAEAALESCPVGAIVHSQCQGLAK